MHPPLLANQDFVMGILWGKCPWNPIFSLPSSQNCVALIQTQIISYRCRAGPGYIVIAIPYFHH